MKNYFFALTNEQIAKLKRSGLFYYPFAIGTRKGIVIEEDALTQLLDTLGLVTVETLRTTYEGVTEVTFREKPTSAGSATSSGTVDSSPRKADAEENKPKVTVQGEWEGGTGSRPAFKKIAETVLLPVIKKNIIFHVPHGERRAAKADDDFHIWIWSSPSERVSDAAPAKIWDIDVSIRDSGFRSTGRGVAIIDTSTNWAVAELIGNNLFIHHDLIHRGTVEEQAIFQRLCEEVADEFLAPEQREKKAEEKRRKEKEALVKKTRESRNVYIQECSRRLNSDLKELKERLAKDEKRRADLSKELVQTIRSADEARSKLDDLESFKSGELEKYGQEFDKIMAFDKVLGLEVKDGVIKVFTDTLCCRDSRTGKLHEIGKFRIEVKLGSDTRNIEGLVHWFNLTRRVDGHGAGMQAPHVFSDGHACLGNAAAIFSTYLAQYEFAFVIMTAIQFIESVNVNDSAGQYIYKWPLAGEIERRKYGDV